MQISGEFFKNGADGGIAAALRALSFGLMLRISELASLGSNPLVYCRGFEWALARYGGLQISREFSEIGADGGIAAPAKAGLPCGLSLCSSELAFGSVRTLLFMVGGSNCGLGQVLGLADFWGIFQKWCRWRDSNPRPTHYECVALPPELHRHGQSVGCLEGPELYWFSG
jgi:hypothetical protein